jgi:hypothetical protein
MGDGYTTDTDQIRAHAANLETLKARFAAVKAASAHITRDDQAYGFMCGWIANVLEGRHLKQDELIAYVEENLSLAAESLRGTADDYDAAEAETTDRMNNLVGEQP